MIVQVDSTMRYREDGTKLCAISILLPHAYQKCMKKLSGEHSNNFSEVAAVLDAISMVVDSATTGEIIIETDSQVAWGWITKNWQIHNTTAEKEKLTTMINRCKELLSRNNRVKLKKIDRKKNMSDLSKVATDDLEKLEMLNV